MSQQSASEEVWPAETTASTDDPQAGELVMKRVNGYAPDSGESGLPASDTFGK